jgi:hypothetical protein
MALAEGVGQQVIAQVGDDLGCGQAVAHHIDQK